jgi:DnaJ-class molecular chaperone
MTFPASPEAANKVRQGDPCPHCGGSGVLRMSDQRFRTCLDCLGQGHLPVFDPQPSLQGLIHRQEDRVLNSPCDGFNAGAVSSGSR